MFDTKRGTYGALPGTHHAKTGAHRAENRGTSERARIGASKKCPGNVPRNVPRLKQLELLSIFSEGTFRGTSTPYPEIMERK